MDSKVRAGGRNVSLPKVPGGDVAGIVVERDEGAKVSSVTKEKSRERKGSRCVYKG